MDCKIILRLFFLIIFFISTHSNAIEFKGKFLQGHYIIGITDPSSKIIIDKKEVKVSEDGYFAFGLDRDRKNNVIIEINKNGKFNIDGNEYNLQINNGEHSLHGGIKGFDKIIWSVKELKGNNFIGLKLNYLSKHMEEGYPGNLNVEIKYMLNDKNEFKI